MGWKGDKTKCFRCGAWRHLNQMHKSIMHGGPICNDSEKCLVAKAIRTLERNKQKRKGE